MRFRVNLPKEDKLKPVIAIWHPFYSRKDSIKITVAGSNIKGVEHFVSQKDTKLQSRSHPYIQLTQIGI